MSAFDPQLRAAAMVSGATMVAFLAAAMVPRYTTAIRLVVTLVYCAGALGFVLYSLL